MWTRIVGALLVLIVVTFAIQWVLPRGAREGRTSARQYLLWDIGPMVAFFSLLLLVLSLIEAERQGFLWAWGWGSALGLVASVAVWLALPYAWRSRPATTRREPVWRLAWRLLRTFGPVIVVVSIGLNLLTRWLGSVVEVFAAGTLGACIIVITLLFLIEAFRRGASATMNGQRERNGK
jgi:hypothetical protein